MTATITAPEIKPERITLYYCEGSSDKVYQASIEPQGELFVVNFAFGRRGSTAHIFMNLVRQLFRAHLFPAELVLGKFGRVQRAACSDRRFG